MPRAELPSVLAMQRHVHASERLGVFGEGSVGADDENVAQFVGIAGADFLDARIVGARGFVGAHDQFDFGGDFGVHRWQRDGIQAACRRLLKSGDGRFCRGAGDQGRGARGVQNAVGRKIVGVGVSGALAGDDANAASGGDSLAGRLDHGLIDHQRGRGEIFEIKVGVVAAGRKRGGQIVLEIAFGEAVVLEEETGFVFDIYPP